MSAALWLAGVVVAVIVVDRVLLAAEARGWINYRRKGLNLGAARYHILETHSVFDPGAETLQQAQVREEEDEDEAGDPP